METISRSHKAKEAKLREDIEAWEAKGNKAKQIPFGQSALNNGLPVDYNNKLKLAAGKGQFKPKGRGL